MDNSFILGMIIPPLENSYWSKKRPSPAHMMARCNGSVKTQEDQKNLLQKIRDGKTHVQTTTDTPENKHDMGKSLFSIGNTSSNGGVSPLSCLFSGG